VKAIFFFFFCLVLFSLLSAQTLETANALRGMKLKRAQRFLENVKLQKEAVPFRNRNGGAGRHAQAKVRVLLSLLSLSFLIIRL
jgi:ribosomal protein L22